MEFWVRSDTMPDGSYGVSIEVGPDQAFVLDRDAALAYVTACHHEATAADHSVAILRLLTAKLGMPAKEAADFVRGHLAQAQAADSDATAPMRYVAAIGRAKHPRPDAGRFIPMITIQCNGSDLGWIEPDQLRDHAGGVLGALAATHLDAELMRALVDEIGVDEQVARGFVSELADFMPGQDRQR